MTRHGPDPPRVCPRPCLSKSRTATTTATAIVNAGPSFSSGGKRHPFMQLLRRVQGWHLHGILLRSPMHTLFHKVWNAHAVRLLPSGQTQLFVGLHLVHEVTSPQAFDMLRQHGWTVPFPNRTFATVDHIVPTSTLKRPFLDVTAEEMTVAL